jgi:hypothetical protein
MPARGFLLVASNHKEYVDSANYCAETIKDNYPEAHITLFVSPQCRQWVDEQAFDIIVSNDDVPNHTRTKLYALSRTPYTELTVYVDADMECRHEDVANIWDEMPEDVDVLITRIRSYNGKIARWPKGEMIHHGGFFMYRTNDRVINFMQRWWEDYFIQRSEPWPYNTSEYPITLRPWDQFTFWKLLNIDKLDIKVEFFKDDARWNFVNGYYARETSSPIVFYHNTIKLKGD